jgi:hypothetical protein
MSRRKAFDVLTHREIQDLRILNVRASSCDFLNRTFLIFQQQKSDKRVCAQRLCQMNSFSVDSYVFVGESVGTLVSPWEKALHKL